MNLLVFQRRIVHGAHLHQNVYMLLVPLMVLMILLRIRHVIVGHGMYYMNVHLLQSMELCLFRQSCEAAYCNGTVSFGPATTGLTSHNNCSSKSAVAWFSFFYGWLFSFIVVCVLSNRCWSWVRLLMHLFALAFFNHVYG
jgi:hypothetical protein